MKKTLRFIVNPFSGTSKKGNLQSEIEQNLDTDKYDYDIVYTEAPEHAIELAKKAVVQNIDVVVAVGGDGSVNEVAQSLIHTDTVLGVLPGGSGNGFALHLGLGRNITKAIKILNTGIVRTIDTCTVNEQFFLNVAGVGFDARIAYMTKRNAKRGFWPYFKTTLVTLKNYRPLDLEIEVDGQIIKGKYAMAEIANATMFGYYFTIAPLAVLDDGKFDLVLVKDASILKYFLSSFRFLTKSLDKSAITQYIQAKHIVIKHNQEDFIHVDGEGMVAAKHLEFNIVPNSLKVLFPK